MHAFMKPKPPSQTGRGAARLILALALLAAGLPALAQTTSTTLRHLNSDTFNKVDLPSDGEIHFVLIGDNEDNTAVFKEILRRANEEKAPYFAIHLGNMVASGTEANYKKFLDQVKDFKLPLLTTIGKSDLDADGGNSLYRQIFGRPYFSFQLGDSAFYFIDDSTPEALDEKQMTWIKRALDQGFNHHKRFVFMHTPLFDPRPNGEKGLPPALANKLLEIFKNAQVTLIFSGAIHARYGGYWDGIRYTICGGGGAGPLEGTSPESSFHNYMVVHVTEQQLSIDVRKITPPAEEKKAGDKAK